MNPLDGDFEARLLELERRMIALPVPALRADLAALRQRLYQSWLWDSGCSAGATVNVTVEGACGHPALAGVSVSDGTTTVTTDGSGLATFTYVGALAATTYTVTAPSARYAGATVTLTPACGATAAATVVLPAATGYHCWSGCPTPLKDALLLTISGSYIGGSTPGSYALNYDSATHRWKTGTISDLRWTRGTSGGYNVAFPMAWTWGDVGGDGTTIYSAYARSPGDPECASDYSYDGTNGCYYALSYSLVSCSPLLVRYTIPTETFGGGQGGVWANTITITEP